MKYVVAILLCLTTSLLAQTTGDLHGTVTDQANHPLAGAKVAARVEGTDVVRRTETNPSGEFQFSAVPVGEYTVEVDLDGFSSNAQHFLKVSLGHVVEISVRLEAGDSQQLLAPATPVVERSSSQLGAVMNSRAVVNLPLNTRNTYQLLQLQPGVESQQGYNLFAGSENAGVVSVNGGRARANNFNVNGGDANDLFLGLPGIQPSPDTIEEFRVLTSTFDAEYGRNSGSVINVVTKSGSNEFHGSGYEFFRNRSLDTRGFFDSVKPKFNQNQFGGTLGGPIRKDRTFVFASAERRSTRQGISSDVVTVPSIDERSGNFSSSSAFSGTLNDAFLEDALNKRSGCAGSVAAAGGAPIAANTRWSSIFPTNRIPTQCFDATAVDLLHQFVPLPNAGTNTLQTVPIKRDDATQPTLRLDHTLTAQNMLSFYYHLDDDALAQPFSNFQAMGANVPGFGSAYNIRNQQINLSDTWSINATTINEARFSYYREGALGYNRPQKTNLVQNSCKDVGSANCFSDPNNPRLGITPSLDAGSEGVPFIQLSGGFSIGNNAAGELPQVGNSFQWSNNLTKIIGAHHMKLGVDVRRQRLDQTLFYNVNGQYTFSGGGVNDVGASNLVPDYLLGLPSNYSQGSSQIEKVRSTALSLFVQDGWSVSKTVTLNYGLRWELNTPMNDVGGRVQSFRPGQATQQYPCQLEASNPLVQDFGTNQCGPGTAGESIFPIGLTVPGDKGVPGGLTATYYRSFAPRLGIAWSPVAASGWLKALLGGPGKSSIRAGWGLFYNPIEQLVLQQFSGEPPFGGTTSLANPMFNTPFLGQDGAVNNNPFRGVMNPVRGQPLDWSVYRPILLFGDFQPRLRPQYSENYNLTLQRELPKSILLQVAYVGSQGHRLLATTDLNFGQAQPCLDLNALSSLANDPALACGPFSADNAYTVRANEIPAGFTLHLPYGASSQVVGPNPNPISLVGLRKYSSPLCNSLTGTGCAPDGIPVFSSIFSQNTIANSNYNSLQIMVEKQAFAGLQFQAAYTYSKSIDNASSFEELLNPLNNRLSRSLSLFDARQRLVFSSNWELPRIAWNGIRGKLSNGWAVSGILTVQAGFPIPITSSDDLELMGSGFFTYPGEPDMVKPLKKLNPRNSQNLAFDPSSFQQPQDAGRIGNSPRSVCCGPGIANIDLSLMKTTRLTEGTSLQFRTEVFNLFNHAQFTKVDGNISNGLPADGGTFGKALLARDPRLIQLVLKLFF